ncbi:L-rhamnose mutarotase [Motilibacter rhizosphaerae]|uniref:L-rhamnose mutarotase n=1 Tax=Motilibacter rhizosphaerae TaxID=598652 RepID=A0A4Q7NWG7_9ACTN|nr:L-rhamnose mutarotase [Motilibacter rhizosphaerae]RZS91653.1 L-rhamnose mutarotase [Motilibacter rhizosphaerae]
MIVALRTRLRVGHEEAYGRDHARVPDELFDALLRAGVTDWHIWRSGLDLFHVVECQDWAQTRASMATEPVEAVWQEHIGQHLEQPVDEEGHPRELLMAPVWSFADQRQGPAVP